MKHCLLVLALAAAHSVAASAAPGALGVPGTAAPRSKLHAADDKYQQWRAAAAATLIGRADANSLATAAALRYVGTGASKTPVPRLGASALDLAARASELAPQSASIGWLHLQLCSSTPSCDIRGVATVMRWVDADNGAAWLQTLAVAQKDKNPTEIDRILADMAHGARFDFYWNPIVAMMVDSLKAARSELPKGFVASDSARLTTASGIAAGEVIPPFAPLMEACRGSSAVSERRDLCLRLSKIMQRGDTVAAQLAGFSLERRLLVPDSKETRAIAERRHVLEWRVATAAKLDNPLLPWTKNARARARLVQMHAMPREEDVCIAILREHRMALEPPEVRP
jgi:hypothetical protein